jgi:hypothetical protein
MIDTIIAFDEQDNTLGAFFQSCINDLNTFFGAISIVPELINSSRLNDLAVNLIISNKKSFVFGAFSHGSADCLVRSARYPYISIATDNSAFNDSFFYTFSCSCGEILGDNLIKNGCHCFIGYKSPVSIWSTFSAPFVLCANHGLKEFFNGHSTDIVFSKMKQKYNLEINAIYKTDFLIASILRENRDALIYHGKNISIKDIESVDGQS